jgi:hypothetical protein
MMGSEEAIRRLRAMQSQIIDGPNTFGEIAGVIERLEVENIRRIKHLNRLASWAQQDPSGPWHKKYIQEWVLKEIACALGSPDRPTLWKPGVVKDEIRNS